MKFNFKSNSLSKGAYLLSIVQVVFFRSKSNANHFVDLIANYFSLSKKQVFLFGAGRMAVYSVLKSLNLKSDDEVIVAGYTCVVLTNSVKFAGCKIKYADINRKTLNIDQAALMNSISDKTKVIIIPHNFGFAAESINEIKSKHPNVIVIEDGAHTFGSSINDKLCGTLGDCAFFSLEYSKPITTGLGGILIVNNEALIQGIQNEYKDLKTTPFKSAFQMLSTLGVMTLCFSKSTQFFHTNGFRFLRLFKLVYQTSQDEVNGILPNNYPVKLRPMLANFGYNQMKNIERINNKKKAIQDELANAFKSFEDIEYYKVENTILARFPILFKEHVTKSVIDTIKTESLEQGFLFGEWFNDVVHPKGSYRYDYTSGACPEGEYVAARILNIPVNVNFPVTTNEIEQMVAIFKSNGIK